jgi:hypothetical protein
MDVAKLKKGTKTAAKWLFVTVITAILASLVRAWMEGKELNGVKGGIPILWRAFLEPAIPVWTFCLVLVVAVAGLPRLLRHKRKRVDLRMVAGNSTQNVWSVGARGSEPILTVSFTMSFAHREPNLSLIIKKTYLEGTEPVISISKIVVAGPYGEEETIHLMLRPVIAKPGKALKGRVVLVDQFGDKHLSERITFMPRISPLGSLNSPAPHSPLNCLFCHQSIAPEDLAREAAVPAHRQCIWKT